MLVFKKTLGGITNNRTINLKILILITVKPISIYIILRIIRSLIIIKEGQTMKSILFSFKGRIGRKQFFLGIGCMLLQTLILFLLLSMTFNPETPVPGPAGFAILAIMMILNTWQSFALYTKRFHDRNKSGWWVLISLVPLIGAIWIIVECGFLKGSDEENRFGENPILNK